MMVNFIVIYQNCFDRRKFGVYAENIQYQYSTNSSPILMSMYITPLPTYRDILINKETLQSSFRPNNLVHLVSTKKE